MKKIEQFLIVGLLGISLVACPMSTSLGQTPTPSGQVPNYTDGEKILKVSQNGTFGSRAGVLKADGSFAVALPIPTNLTSIIAGGCQSGSYSVVPPDGSVGVVSVGVFNNENDTTPTGYLTQTETGNLVKTEVLRIYANKDTVYTFNNCVLSNTLTYKGSLTLKLGWNEINIEQISPDWTFGMGTRGKPWRIESFANF